MERQRYGGSHHLSHSCIQSIAACPRQRLSPPLAAIAQMPPILPATVAHAAIAKVCFQGTNIRNGEYSSSASPTDQVTACVMSERLQSNALEQKLAICVDIC